MKYKNFFNIIDSYKRGSEMISDLHDLGFDLMEGRYQLSNILFEQLKQQCEKSHVIRKEKEIIDDYGKDITAIDIELFDIIKTKELNKT